MGTSKKCLRGKPVDVKPISEVGSPEDFLLNCMPAFGGAYVRRIFRILDQAIGREVPLIIAVAGPVTVSNQHRAWLNPLLETGWVAYLSTTDAVCYHDGHDLLRKFRERPIHQVPISGADAELKKAGIIRITDTGFSEQVLFDQDRFFSALLRQPEFQRKMTGTEFRNLIGKYYAAQEKKYGAKPGLLSTCWKNDIPVFVGAPGDGSVFLNSVKLWMLNRAGKLKYKFDIDVHAEVFESCAYHFWGLTASKPKQLAILILGGGVPKNFSLQPEPTLSQIFMLDNISGYEYDVQIVGAPVTFGDLTGCEPSEAVTWGKVDEDALEGQRVESLHADYTTIMPLIAWALIDKRQRLMRMEEKLGMKELCKRHPEAKGYLRPGGQYRLFDRRDGLTAKLLNTLKKRGNMSKIMRTLDFPLALLERASG